MGINEYIKNKGAAKQPPKPLDKADLSASIDRYSRLDETELMQELFRVGSVSSGGISASELDTFYSNVQAFISPEQSEKMKELIRQLKNN